MCSLVEAAQADPGPSFRYMNVMSTLFFATAIRGLVIVSQLKQLLRRIFFTGSQQSEPVPGGFIRPLAVYHCQTCGRKLAS